jgi:hypothetical protein
MSAADGSERDVLPLQVAGLARARRFACELYSESVRSYRLAGYRVHNSDQKLGVAYLSPGPSLSRDAETQIFLPEPKPIVRPSRIKVKLSL